MAYTLENTVSIIRRQLELDSTEDDITEGHIAQCLNELPMDRFWVPKGSVTLTANPSGQVMLPRDFAHTTDSRPIFLGLLPLTKSVILPMPYNSITFEYMGMPTDDEGMPVIPDPFQKALMLYVDAEHVFKKQWRKGQINYNTYDAAARLWKNEIGRVRGEVNRMSAAEFEQFAQVRNSLFLR